MRFVEKLERSRVWFYFLIGLAFSFPFGRPVIQRVFLAWAFISVVHYLFYRKSFQTTFSKVDGRLLLLLCLPVFYYIWNLVGMLYTENSSEGLSQLERELSFVFVPVFFLFFRDKLSEIDIAMIFTSFVAGIILSAAISLFMGFYHSFHVINGDIIFRTAVNDVSYARGDSFFEQQTQGGNYFFGDYISPFIDNIIYYGIYLSFGVMVTLYIKQFSAKLWIRILCPAIIFIVLFLCDSKGPLISFFLAVIVVSLISLRRKSARIIAPLILILGVVLWLSPRTSLLVKDFNTIRSNITYTTNESTALRIVVWKAAIEVLEENWIFGVGTGDAENAMLGKTKNVNEMAFKKKLNAHNQYLQTGITSGVIGLSLLVAMLSIPLYYAWIRRDYLFTAFICIIGFNMLFESVLQVFHGVQFFIFFYCLLTIKLFRYEGTVVS